MDTPFRDFAGSTVVHTVGGFIALAGAIALGPRLGRKFKRDGGGMPPGHDMTIAAIGGVILWFGWYGFNPGSTLVRARLEGIGRVADQHDAGGGSRWSRGVVRSSTHGSRCGTQGMTINGFLGGLVAITCPCYWVNPVRRDHHRRGRRRRRGATASTSSSICAVDDPIGAVAVHGFCGIWGTLSLGLFATGQFGVPGATGADKSTLVEGLFWGGGCDQLKSQFIGSATVTVITLAAGLALMYAVKATGPCASRQEGERRGHRHPRARRARLSPGDGLHGGVVQRRCRVGSFGGDELGASQGVGRVRHRGRAGVEHGLARR